MIECLQGRKGRGLISPSVNLKGTCEKDYDKRWAVEKEGLMGACHEGSGDLKNNVSNQGRSRRKTNHPMTINSSSQKQS